MRTPRSFDGQVDVDQDLSFAQTAYWYLKITLSKI